MTDKKRTAASIATLTVAILSATLLTTTTGVAWAHGSGNLVINGNANKTVSIAIGELNEPVYPDTTSGMDLILKDFLTSLPLTNAQKQQGVITATAPTKLFADEYFYPKGVTPGVVKTSDGVTAAATDGSDIPSVKAKSGYIDSKIKSNISGQFGKPGSYSGDTLLYTETGRTLYHVYGDLNYYNDTSVKIDFWADGGSIGMGKGGQLTNGTGTNSTFSIKTSSFGEKDKTTQYWPGSSAGITNATHPVSIPAALGKGGDIWSFLKVILNTINTITGVTPGTAP